MFEIFDNCSPLEQELTARLLVGLSVQNAEQKFLEAARENLPMAVRQIGTDYGYISGSGSRDIRFRAATIAVNANASYALHEILKSGGFDFTSSGDSDGAKGQELVRIASQKKCLSSYALLCQTGKSYGDSWMSNARASVSSVWSSDVWEFCRSENINPVESPLLAAATKEAAPIDADFFRMMLTYILKKDKGSASLAVIVGANPKGFENIFKDVLKTLSDESLKTLAETGFVKEGTVKTIDQYLENLRYKKEDRYTLSDTQNLTGGICLTTIFNFKTQQQIVIAERNGQSMTMDVKSFDDILGSDALAAARSKLAELGGCPDEAFGIGKKPPRSSGASLNSLGVQG